MRIILSPAGMNDPFISKMECEPIVTDMFPTEGPICIHICKDGCALHERDINEISRYLTKFLSKIRPGVKVRVEKFTFPSMRINMADDEIFMQRLKTCDIFYFAGFGAYMEGIKRLFDFEENRTTRDVLRFRVLENKMLYIGICGGAKIGGYCYRDHVGMLLPQYQVPLFDFFHGINIYYDDGSTFDIPNVINITAGCAVAVSLGQTDSTCAQQSGGDSGAELPPGNRCTCFVVVKSKARQKEWQEFSSQNKKKLSQMFASWTPPPLLPLPDMLLLRHVAAQPARTPSSRSKSDAGLWLQKAASKEFRDRRLRMIFRLWFWSSSPTTGPRKSLFKTPEDLARAANAHEDEAYDVVYAVFQVLLEYNDSDDDSDELDNDGASQSADQQLDIMEKAAQMNILQHFYSQTFKSASGCPDFVLSVAVIQERTAMLIAIRQEYLRRCHESNDVILDRQDIKNMLNEMQDHYEATVEQQENIAKDKREEPNAVHRRKDSRFNLYLETLFGHPSVPRVIFQTGHVNHALLELAKEDDNNPSQLAKGSENPLRDAAWVARKNLRLGRELSDEQIKGRCLSPLHHLLVEAFRSGQLADIANEASENWGLPPEVLVSPLKRDQPWEIVGAVLHTVSGS